MKVNRNPLSSLARFHFSPAHYDLRMYSQHIISDDSNKVMPGEPLT